MTDKLLEFKFDMLPSDERRVVLEDFVLLDDNLDSPDNLNIIDHVSSHVFPLKLTFPIVILCKQGEMVIHLNLEEYRIGANDVLMMVPGTIGEGVSASKDCHIAMMAIPENAFPLLMKMEHSLQFREHMGAPLLLHLSDDEMAYSIQIFRLMRTTIDLAFPHCKEILMNLMEAISFLSISKLESMSQTDVKKQRGDMLFHQFMDEVRRNYTTERQLAFYADKLCITTKYLSRIVKQHSGRHPSDWIRDYVILESKALLRQNDYSVQQISDMLNFPNPSFFGKYFKAETGMSPRQYQLQKEVE